VRSENDSAPFANLIALVAKRFAIGLKTSGKSYIAIRIAESYDGVHLALHIWRELTSGEMSDLSSLAEI